MGRNKSPIEGKSPFKLRRRLLKDGRFSLFIDHFSEGKHEYEFLHLYLLPENSESNKRENHRILRQAEEILRLKRTKYLMEKDKGKETEEPSEMLLSDFIDTLINKYKKEGKAGYRHLETAKINLQKFRDSIHLYELNIDFCREYFEWLQKIHKSSNGKNLTRSTIHIYMRKLGLILMHAYRMGYIDSNLWKLLGKECKIRDHETEKRYLRNEELTILTQTPYGDFPVVREAFLFACFSGLRISDIRNLKWENIINRKECRYVTKTIQKTKKEILLPLSQLAWQWLPKKKVKEDLVFPGLPVSSCLQKHLNRWASNAGIIGKLHFHVSRHTFATLLLSSGSDIYTTSSLLGHSDIRTTQCYAKVVDRSKVEAMKLMDDLIFQHQG